MKMLDGDPSAPALKSFVYSLDNLSEAGKQAVFLIEELIKNLDSKVSHVLTSISKTHQWEELVRNVIT